MAQKRHVKLLKYDEDTRKAIERTIYARRNAGEKMNAQILILEYIDKGLKKDAYKHEIKNY